MVSWEILTIICPGYVNTFELMGEIHLSLVSFPQVPGCSHASQRAPAVSRGLRRPFCSVFGRAKTDSESLGDHKSAGVHILRTRCALIPIDIRHGQSPQSEDGATDAGHFVTQEPTARSPNYPPRFRRSIVGSSARFVLYATRGLWRGHWQALQQDPACSAP